MPTPMHRTGRKVKTNAPHSNGRGNKLKLRKAITQPSVINARAMDILNVLFIILIGIVWHLPPLGEVVGALVQELLRAARAAGALALAGRCCSLAASVAASRCLHRRLAGVTHGGRAGVGGSAVDGPGDGDSGGNRCTGDRTAYCLAVRPLATHLVVVLASHSATSVLACRHADRTNTR